MRSASCVSAPRLADSARAWRQSERVHDPLEIVISVIFDLDPSTFFAVMNSHVCREMLLQSVLQILDCGRASGLLSNALPPPGTANSELAGHKPFCGTNRRVAAQHRFGG
jgi:hypothetical protein